MLIAADESRALIVKRGHIRAAIDESVKLIPNYSAFVMSSGKSTVAELISVLIEDIWTAKSRSVSKRDFMTRHFHQFDLELFEKATATLEAAELIKSTLNSATSDFSYVVTIKCIEVFKLKEKQDGSAAS
jgi:hypothetical protein